MSQPDFLVHDKADNVGVIVVETVEAGKILRGLVMEQVRMSKFRRSTRFLWGIKSH